MRQLIFHPLEQLCLPVSQATKAAIGISKASLPSLLVIL